MRETKISIVVPVYNAEKELQRCVDSIFRQSFSNWELLLIDDGSRDSSSALCDRLGDCGAGSGAEYLVVGGYGTGIVVE